MVEIVYTLTFLTSAAVAVLLMRGFRRSGARLLLWCALGFVGLCLNNLMLIVDLILVPDVDLAVYRAIPMVIGLALMVYGLIWDSARP